ncbi:MAG TPA: M20/M25/M40 family metallo-hydrolase [Ktedonobacteraceae bacterium]|nr:M20/M25/M40 family metallo-hydrolase [Ktedonobacteraceae bacterium]
MSTSSSSSEQSTLFQRPAELLQQLIRFNTTNPPGNEAACIAYISNLLSEAGIENTLVARDPARPNLIARLTGQGNAPPLLLQGHVDVVTAEKQFWQHPPFEGGIYDGYIWGRGTLDMKGGVAMMIAALLRAKADDASLPGDVLLAVLSDEEASSTYGAKFLVENHAELFKDVRYALGEFGGFTMHIGNQRFYPIQVMEKKTCGLKVILRGPGGHGALPMRNGTLARLGRFIQALDEHRLPVHITSVTRQMIETLGSALSTTVGPMLLQLLEPTQTDRVLDMLGQAGQTFDPILHNTANITIIHGGEKNNVIPSEMVVTLDGRLLPGYGPEDMIAEMLQLVGNDIELEVTSYDPGPAEPDMGLFDTLAGILKEADPEGTPLPNLLPAVTDGRFFTRLGIQTYGFLPMLLPEGFNFTQTIHAADERIPVVAVEFGTNAIYEAMKRNKA